MSLLDCCSEVWMVCIPTLWSVIICVPLDHPKLTVWLSFLLSGTVGMIFETLYVHLFHLIFAPTNIQLTLCPFFSAYRRWFLALPLVWSFYQQEGRCCEQLELLLHGAPCLLCNDGIRVGTNKEYVRNSNRCDQTSRIFDNEYTELCS